jgi:ArsR family transcriptional regulator
MAARVETISKKKVQGCLEDIAFERQAQICKAFANPVRLKIIDQVSRGECSATELQETLGISKANLSQHIAVLKTVGVIGARRDGKQLYYSLAIPEVKQACQLVRKVLYAQLEGAKQLLR